MQPPSPHCCVLTLSPLITAHVEDEQLLLSLKKPAGNNHCLCGQPLRLSLGKLRCQVQGHRRPLPERKAGARAAQRDLLAAFQDFR